MDGWMEKRTGSLFSSSTNSSARADRPAIQWHGQFMEAIAEPALELLALDGSA